MRSLIFLILLSPLFLSALSGCAAQDSGSYAVLQGQSEAGKAAQASKKASGDLLKLKKTNKELEATLQKLESLRKINEEKLVQCEAAVRKLGVKVTPH